jgi:8-oxo-dGTP pyrophosphatase MutT (NUDIX family)
VSRDPARKETSAGGVVVRFDGGEPLFLVIRDSYRNWGFPKGHLKRGEQPADAAVREVLEETGLPDVTVRGPIDTINWRFVFRGRAIHKICHFFLMDTTATTTEPQRSEGITACRWVDYDTALKLVPHDNARGVLRRARTLVAAGIAGA